jgi:uncharacterized membrane protein YeaQ/YmgE (transglycosylase-associated protein family)
MTDAELIRSLAARAKAAIDARSAELTALDRAIGPNGQSLIAGLVGSFVGGLLASLIAGDGLDLRPSGLIGSFVGAVVVLLIWRAMDSRSTA